MYTMMIRHASMDTPSNPDPTSSRSTETKGHNLGSTVTQTLYDGRLSTPST